MTDRSKPPPPLTEDLQSLVTGALIGAVYQCQDWLAIDVEPVVDGDFFTGRILITGRESGIKLAINVEVLADGPG